MQINFQDENPPLGLKLSEFHSNEDEDLRKAASISTDSFIEIVESYTSQSPLTSTPKTERPPLQDFIMNHRKRNPDDRKEMPAKKSKTGVWYKIIFKDTVQLMRNTMYKFYGLDDSEEPPHDPKKGAWINVIQEKLGVEEVSYNSEIAFTGNVSQHIIIILLFSNRGI